MAKWNPLALKLLMWLFGLLMVVSSAATFAGDSLFWFGAGWGITAPVAGIAFGCGIMIAGFDPVANVSWVRAIVLYAILEIVYQIVVTIVLGRFDVISFVVAIIVAAIVLVLYPNKPALWMQTGKAASGARA